MVEEEGSADFITSYYDLPVHAKNVFQSILKTYEPAKLREPSERKSTKEIYDEIIIHCGCSFPLSLVSEFLTEHEFLFDQGSEFEFFWLMKRRH